MMSRYKKARHLIATYKFNSIFTKTLAFLTLFSIIVLLGFYTYISNFSAKNLMEESRAANVRLVQQAANSADLVITGLSSNMRSVLFNKSVIPVVIAPRGQSVEKKSALTQQLNYAVKNSPMLQNAVVFIELTEEVFSASGKVEHMNEYTERPVLEEYFSAPYLGLLDYPEGYATDIRFIDGRLFLFQEFPDILDIRAGTLMYELDIQALLDSIDAFSHDASHRVLVYRPDGSALQSNPSYENAPDFIDLQWLDGADGFFHYSPEAGPEQTIFFYQSEHTGWLFICPVPSSELRLTFAPTMGFIPFVLFFLAASALLGLYITSMIYKPIQQLLDSISQPQSNSPAINDAKNELDFLGIAYNDVKSRQDTITGMMENISPTVLERLFTNCLHGKEVSSETIAQTLQSLPVPFREDDRYMVTAVLLSTSHDAATVEQDFYAISATNLIHTCLENKCDYFTIRMEDMLLAVILRFSSDISATKIKQAAMQFSDDLTEHSKSMPYLVQIGRGRIYNHASDLHYSYRNAVEELKHQSYFQAPQETVEKIADEPYYDKIYFIGRISHIAERIDEQNYETAAELCTRILSEISANVSDVEMARDISAILYDTLIEKLLLFKASSNNPLLLERPPIEKELRRCSSVEELCRYLSDFCEEIFPLFELYYKKAQHRHIVKAKEIIESEYADSGLSLNRVAEEIGIHPSYLSRLFGENLGVSFLDYLNEFRIEQAKVLLKSTSMPVKEIGFKTGFQSMPTFFRVFKKYCGVPPGQYRG